MQYRKESLRYAGGKKLNKRNKGYSAYFVLVLLLLALLVLDRVASIWFSNPFDFGLFFDLYFSSEVG